MATAAAESGIQNRFSVTTCSPVWCQPRGSAFFVLEGLGETLKRLQKYILHNELHREWSFLSLVCEWRSDSFIVLPHQGPSCDCARRAGWQLMGGGGFFHVLCSSPGFWGAETCRERLNNCWWLLEKSCSKGVHSHWW